MIAMSQQARFWADVEIVATSAKFQASQRERAKRRLQQTVDCVQTVRQIAHRSLCQGEKALWEKASSAEIFGHPDYDVNFAADHAGIDISRLQKFQRCRCLVEGLGFDTFLGLMNFLWLGFSDVEEVPVKKLVVIAGMCRAVSKVAQHIKLDVQTNLSKPLSLQAGLLLGHFVWHPEFWRIYSMNWQDTADAKRQLRHDKKLKLLLDRQVSKVNSEIAEMPRLAEMIDLLSSNSLPQYMAEAMPFAVAWFLTGEITFERLEEAGCPTFGIFDPYCDSEGSAVHFHNRLSARRRSPLR